MATLRNSIIILVLVLLNINTFSQKSIFWLNKPNENNVQWVESYGDGTNSANIFHAYSIPSFLNTSSFLYKYIGKIDWSGERWVTIRQENFGSQRSWLCYSFDGVNWTDYSISGVNSFFWDEYNKTWVVSATTSGTNYTLKSNDGINWISQVSNIAFSKIISSGTRYVGVSGSYVIYSRDAITWKSNDLSNIYPNASLKDVVWNGSIFAVVGSFTNEEITKQAIWVSTDGSNYSLSFRDDYSSIGTLQGIDYFQNKFIVSESVKVYKSTDLITLYSFFGNYSLVTSKYVTHNKDKLLINGTYYDGYSYINDMYEYNYTLEDDPIIYNNIPAYFNNMKHRSVVKYDELKATCPEVSLAVYNFSVNYMDMENTLITDGALNIISRGICYSTAENPTINDGVVYTSGESTDEIIRVQPLSGGTTYHMRAFVQNEQCLTYSNEITLVTYDALPAIIATVEPSNVSSVSAISGGIIYSDGGGIITSKGACWSTAQYPTTANTHTSNGTGSGNFTSNIYGLSPSTTYYVRAYAENSASLVYGDQYSFTTTVNQTIPLVTTGLPLDITNTSAHLYGNVDSDGGSTVSENGFCYSTSPNTTISGTHTAIGSGVGSFDVILSGLATGQIYYIKAYAINGIGVGYGEEKTVSTINGDLATVITYGAFNVTETSAYIGGSITDDGGSTIAHSGFIIALNTSQDPTLETNLFFTQVSGYSSEAQFVGLTAGTEYKARIYATNDAGTTYGNIINFQTVSSGVVPIVTTAPIVNIQNTSATGGGNVTFDGGSSVTARGVQFSLNSNFTSLVGSTTNGTGIGTYSSNIIGLSCGVTYFVRAYATNSSGTGYGSTVSFITNSSATVSIASFSAVTSTSFTANCSVTSSCSNITSRGIIYSTSSGVTYPTNAQACGSGTGTYDCTPYATLSPSTTYYVKSYVIVNGSAIYLSLESTVTTLAIPPVDPCTLSVGDSYGGGIVAYIYQSGDPGYISGECHGIISATSDQGTAAYFGCYGSNLSGASSILLKGGQQNTIDIIAGCSDSGTSARLCYDYSSGSYSDWWLPSLNELLKLYANRSLIGGFNISAVYSSSSEVDAYSVYSVNFVDGSYSVGSNTKLYPFYVRAIRYF